MYGNALGAKALSIHSHLQQIGCITSARVAERGNFIDID
jgi:hypothetical protein